MSIDFNKKWQKFINFFSFDENSVNLILIAYKDYFFKSFRVPLKRKQIPLSILARKLADMLNPQNLYKLLLRV